MNKKNNHSPLLFVLICIALGIYIQSFFPLPLLAPLGFMGVSFVGLFFNRAIKKASIGISCFCLGALLLQRQINNQQALFKIYSDTTNTIVGLVVNKQKIPSNSYMEQIIFQANKVKQDTKNNTWKPADFKLLCSIPQTIKVDIGDTIKLNQITIKKPNSKKALLGNNLSFNYYLLRNNLLSSLFLNYKQLSILHKPTSSLARLLWHTRENLLKRIKQKLHPLSFQFFSQLFLGNKHELYKNKLKQPFGHWGLAHYLARSGLHIVLFIFAWIMLLQFIPINFYIKRIFLIVLCCLYSILSWTSLSYIRAFSLFLLKEGGTFVNRKPNLLHLLTLLSIVTLLLNPVQLFFLDFQLSFGLTFTLLLFAPRFVAKK